MLDFSNKCGFFLLEPLVILWVFPTHYRILAAMRKSRYFEYPAYAYMIHFSFDNHRRIITFQSKTTPTHTLS